MKSALSRVLLHKLEKGVWGRCPLSLGDHVLMRLHCVTTILYLWEFGSCEGYRNRRLCIRPYRCRTCYATRESTLGFLIHMQLGHLGSTAPGATRPSVEKWVLPTGSSMLVRPSAWFEKMPRIHQSINDVPIYEDITTVLTLPNHARPCRSPMCSCEDMRYETFYTAFLQGGSP